MRPRTTNVLKLLHGTATPSRERAEIPLAKLGGKPKPVARFDLTDRERAVFEELSEWWEALGHAQCDALLICQLARVSTAARDAEAKVKELGSVMRATAKTQSKEQPYSTLARKLRAEERDILTALAVPPIWRMRLAKPQASALRPSDWSAID